MHVHLSLVPLLALPLTLGCATPAVPEPAESGASSDVGASDDGADDNPLVLESAPLPTSLSCVSSAVSEWAPEVLRVSIVLDGETGSVAMQRGPQFWSHSGVWSEPIGEPDVRAVTVVDGHLSQDTLYGIDIALERDGAFVRGTLVDDQCYSRLTTELTCWNEAELFGSPWTGEAGALAAHFDWETGACLDDGGNAAVNDLPVEFVRETGYGECADLRGTALNGEDFGHPDLSGWYLVGAQLNEATLFFANLQNSTLHGARLAEITFGYATIEGTVDDFTELPEDCKTTESSWSGATTVCSR